MRNKIIIGGYAQVAVEGFFRSFDIICRNAKGDVAGKLLSVTLYYCL